MYRLLRFLLDPPSTAGSGKRRYLKMGMLNEIRNKACLFSYFCSASVHVSVKFNRINVIFFPIRIENVSSMQGMIRWTENVPYNNL